MDCHSDAESDDMDNFVMLSTNKNPVNDIEDDTSSEDGLMDAEKKFVLISSSGPAADYQSDMFGVYRLSEEMREGQSVYIQEHNTQ